LEVYYEPARDFGRYSLLEEDLLAFERKFGIRSETFFAAYVSGEEPENEGWVLDFGEWASVYRTWLARQAGRIPGPGFRRITA